MPARQEPFDTLRILGRDYILRETLTGYLGEECQQHGRRNSIITTAMMSCIPNIAEQANIRLTLRWGVRSSLIIIHLNVAPELS